MDLITIMKRYNTEGKCYSLLEKLKWPEGPVCPHCGSKRASKRKDNRYNCNKCNCSYSVLHDTIFEASKIPLQKWFIGISLILNAKMGISSLQLARDLKVNRKTAWFLQSRIRSGMKEEDEILNGVVEADETYIGGSLENQHYFKKRKKERLNKTGFSHKDTVLGMIQRKGKIIVVHLKDGASGKEIKPILQQKVPPKSKMVTDGYGAYYGLSKMFKKHYVLNSSKFIRNYGRYHTNSIEGFWSLLKRAISGQYHRLSSNHLQSYLDEIAFKFNHRNDPNHFESFLINVLRI